VGIPLANIYQNPDSGNTLPPHWNRRLKSSDNHFSHWNAMIGSESLTEGL
jgi:hypothetical protein